MKKILIATTVLATTLTAATFAQAAQKQPPKKPTARQAYAQVIEPVLPVYSGYCEYRTYWGDCVYDGYYYAYGAYPFGYWAGPWYYANPPRPDYSVGGRD